MGELRTGLLLVNLGTPDSPGVADVRRYLREFLSDPRVIDIPAPARWLLLNAVILPFRPRTSARAYEKIWTEAGSPLRVNGEALRDAVAERLGERWVVELAMRYGQPAIPGALARLAAAGVERLVVLPLFPQHSQAATESAVAKVEAELPGSGLAVPVKVIDAFYDDPGFVAAVAAVARPVLEEFRPDFVLLSYHGVPERQLRGVGRPCLLAEDCCHGGDAGSPRCYRAHCYATTRALARELALAPDRHTTSFQSRLGRTPWIQPFTDHVLPQLAERGVRRLAVLCPSFVADCLETLEEIGIRAADQWRELGGEALRLVPCVNAHPRWADAVATLARHHAPAP